MQPRHVLLPIGSFTKERVREIARELELPVAAKQESQEICFIPDDDTVIGRGIIERASTGHEAYSAHSRRGL